jgi:hypothetical protein
MSPFWSQRRRQQLHIGEAKKEVMSKENHEMTDLAEIECMAGKKELGGPDCFPNGF